jgi:hypothetical protein
MITIKRKKWYAAAVSAAILTATPLLITSTAQAVPADQTGEVHSCTTNGDAGVRSTTGGQIWLYTGSGGGNPNYPVQTGVVHSYTTGGNANVHSGDGGLSWFFYPSGALFCSPP